MSASSLCVTCGTLSHERCRKGPDTFLIRGRAAVSIGPNFEKSCAGISGIPAPAPGRGGGLGRALQERQQVVLGDPALRPGRGDRGQVHAQLAGHPPHARAGVYPRRRVVDSDRAAGGAAGCRGAGRRGRRRRGGCGLLLFHQRRRGADRAVAGSEQQDEAALADLVADLDQDLGHRAGDRGGDVHRGLVGLQGDQRVLGVDLVAGATCTSMIGTTPKSPMSGTLTSIGAVMSIVSFLIGSDRSGGRVRLVRVDAVAGDGIGCGRGRNGALGGQLGQRRERDVVTVDLEVPAQLAPVVRAAEPVGAQHPVTPVT